MKLPIRSIQSLALLLTSSLLVGCASPSPANNKLRRENQDLKDQIRLLKREQAGDRATIAALEHKAGTQPSTDQTKIEHLFTVHGISLGRLSGTDDGAGGFQVQATPTDEQRQKIKAAGTFVIDAFDLADRSHPQLGHWTFDAKESRDAWNGEAFQYSYVLNCPWQTPPAHSQMTLRVAFTDLLTGREFVVQKLVNVSIPTTRPAASTAALSTP